MSKKITIYGFSGKLGSGKNYLAETKFNDMLGPNGPALIMAFADQLKIDLIARDKIDYNSIFHTKDHQSRVALQKYGTDMREKYGPNIWINYLDNWIKMHVERGIRDFIITDVRFPNEFAWIKSLGGIVIRVEAPGRNLDELNKEAAGDPIKLHQIASHASETALDNHRDQFDYILNNDYGCEKTVLIELQKIADKNKLFDC